MEINIRRAQPSDALFLTSISFGAKRYWNYPEEYFEIWHDDLTITEEYINTNIVYVAQKKDTIIGYFSIVEVKQEYWKGDIFIRQGYWLERIYVRPAYIQSGIGSQLMEYATRYCRENYIETLYMYSDPHTNGFFERFGAKMIKESLSRIDGRTIFLYEYVIPEKTSLELLQEEEENERLRIEQEEAIERFRLEREEEVAERLRLQLEEEAEILRLQQEEDERLRLGQEEEEAERLRLEQEEEEAERLRLQQEEEEAERLRLQQEEEEAERLRLQQEEEERAKFAREKDVVELLKGLEELEQYDDDDDEIAVTEEFADDTQERMLYEEEYEDEFDEDYDEESDIQITIPRLQVDASEIASLLPPRHDEDLEDQESTMETASTVRSEKDKMLAGELYIAWGDEIAEDRRRARRLLKEFNNTDEEDKKTATKLLEELLGSTGEYIHIEPGFKCDYGYNIHVGDNFYANNDCTILDSCEVRIGDNCILSPKVGIYTSAYPLDVNKRVSGYEYAKPITIGNNVWIGGSAVINQGVTIGNNVVVQPGSVVLSDVPDNVLVGGNPAQVIKELNEE